MSDLDVEDQDVEARVELEEMAAMIGFGDESQEEDDDEDRTNVKFVMFDFESMFVNNEHTPNFCVADWRCKVCLQNKKEGKPRDEIDRGRWIQFRPPRIYKVNRLSTPSFSPSLDAEA